MGLATPTDTGLYGAFGNETSCTVMGALFMFVFVVCMGYNAALAVFFFISIHLTKWTERDFTKKVEPFLHTIPFLYALVGVIVGLLTKMFSTNDIFMYCWAAPSPFGCRYDGNEGASCQHGNTLRDAFVFGAGLVEFNLLTTVKVIATFTLYHTVLQQQKKMQAKYHAKSSGNTIAKETGIQAILFFLSCVVPYALQILLRIMDLYFWQEEIVKTPAFFWFSVISQLMFPCQGIMNMICYFRPKVKERQRKVGAGEESLLHSLLVLIEVRSGKATNFAAPGGTYGGSTVRFTAVSATPGTSQADKPDAENGTALDDNDANGAAEVENVDDIGYLDVTELEKAVGHTFVLGEEMIGDTKNRILHAIEERRQKSSTMELIKNKQQSPPKSSSNQPSATIDNTEIKRVDMTGEVIVEQTNEEEVGISSES